MINNLQDFSESDYLRPNQSHLEQPLSVLTGETEVALVPGVRSKRKVFIFGTFAFTVGALLILFNSPYRNDFLAPGPLSSVHANILKGHGADRCAACHEAGNFSVAAWVKDTVSGGKHLTQCQSDLCMECHDKTLPADFAMMPHGTNPAQLSKMTSVQKKLKRSGFDAGMIFKAPVNQHGEIACSACHREHHGMQINLSAMTDRQCQSCHQNVFHSFETDHPEFTRWPQTRRDRIAFDHTTHFGKHFPAKNAKFNCNQCHLDDSMQNVKVMAPFQQACASCHNQQILDSSQDGMKLFSLPMIDTVAITEAKLNVGQWPQNATGDFDGELPPIMRVLLSSNPQAAKLLKELGADFEFSDIDPDNLAQVTDAVELVWHIKELLYEMSLSGPEAMRRRLETVKGNAVTPLEIDQLAQGLSPAVFQEAARRWLPNLSNEVPLHRQGKDDRSVSWIPTDNDLLFHLVNQDDDELAPNPLAGLMGNQAAAQPESPQKTIVRNSEPLPEPNIPRQPSTQETGSSPKVVVNRYLDDENNPDVLAENPMRKLLERIAGTSNADEPGGVAMPSETVQPSMPREQPQVAESDPDDEVQEYPRVDVAAPTFLAVSTNSGWFRDDLSLAIVYRPIGHADPFLVAWTDYTTSIPQAETKHELKPLFETLTTPTAAAGMCSSCHTVDRQEDASFISNWQTSYRDPSIREFTKFSHRPHLIQQECADCHVLDPESNKTEEFVGFDGGLIRSNFFPINKMNCAKCHSKGQTDSSCTQCHNYHIGSRVSEPFK